MKSIFCGTIRHKSSKTKPLPLTSDLGTDLELSSSTDSDDSASSMPEHRMIPEQLLADELLSPLRTLELSPICRKERVCYGGNCLNTGRGQIKIAVYVNYGLLTIHVIEARKLASLKGGKKSGSYVKLSLSPDHSGRTCCMTAMVNNNNNNNNSPVFDEKFSFELLPQDFKKRLLISVWEKESDTDNSEFIGCTSFGVQHIMTEKKVVNGWYYLLAGDIGQRKHLQVTSKAKTHKLASTSLDRSRTDSHVFVIRKGQEGFGFSLKNSEPVKIYRVEPGSAAESSGLQKDDCVSRLNGINVSKCSCDALAAMVKSCNHKIILEVERATKPLKLRNPLSSTLVGSQKESSCHRTSQKVSSPLRASRSSAHRDSQKDSQRDSEVISFDDTMVTPFCMMLPKRRKVHFKTNERTS